MRCGISQSKKTKTEYRWIDRYTQEVLGFSVGSRGKKTFKDLIRQIEKYSVGHNCSDDWKIYKSLPSEKRLLGKK